MLRVWLKRILVVLLALMSVSVLDWFVVKSLLFPFKVESVFTFFPFKVISFSKPVKGSLMWFPGIIKLETEIFSFTATYDGKDKWVAEYTGIFSGTGEIRFKTEKIVVFDGVGRGKFDGRFIKREDISCKNCTFDWYFLRMDDGRWLLDFSVNCFSRIFRVSVINGNVKVIGYE